MRTPYWQVAPGARLLLQGVGAMAQVSNTAASVPVKAPRVSPLSVEAEPLVAASAVQAPGELPPVIEPTASAVLFTEIWEGVPRKLMVICPSLRPVSIPLSGLEPAL